MAHSPISHNPTYKGRVLQRHSHLSIQTLSSCCAFRSCHYKTRPLYVGLYEQGECAMVIRTGMTLRPPRGIGAWFVDECSRSGHMGDFDTGRYLRGPDTRDTLRLQGGCRTSR